VSEQAYVSGRLQEDEKVKKMETSINTARHHILDMDATVDNSDDEVDSADIPEPDAIDDTIYLTSHLRGDWSLKMAPVSV
jgi:hypothetical protein